MSLNYSFIDDSNVNEKKGGIRTIKKPVESLASKVKRRLKRKPETKGPVAQYEVFEDSDNEMLGQFDSDEADREMSKLDPGSGPIHAKNNGVQERQKRPVAPVQLPPQESSADYVKHYNAPGFNAIMQANDAEANNNPGPIQLSSPQIRQPSVRGDAMVSGNQELLTKLNYLIHLLEDQKEERVGSITEELVLYCFLGVFIIFVLDSFVKVGKYVR
jgi:hypothetical protein